MTINHEEPDRVPLDVWLSPEVAEELTRLLDIDDSQDAYALPKKLGHDLLISSSLGIAEGFKSLNYEERRGDDGLYTDKFGIKWRRADYGRGTYCEFAQHPLANLEDYASYSWPDPAEAERPGLEACAELVARDGERYAIMGANFCTLLEGCWFLRGLENFLVDIVANQDFAAELLDKFVEYNLTASKALVELGIDILWWGDDVSEERGPLISPSHFRRSIKPRYAAMVQEVRAVNRDIKIAFHTDGKIDWALDDLADIGFDILNPLQPDVNDVGSIKRRYGERFTFWGNADTRKVISAGSSADVVEEVKNVIRTLSSGGGHIFSTNHRIQTTARALDNVLALYWAFGQFSEYPLACV
jgi:uroporphyrinogen decarboxylase